MTRGLHRYYGAEHCHFITTSCYHRQPFLDSAPLRDLLLQVLEDVRVRYTLVVLGYVVMPEHFHSLITEPQRGDPSKVMQALKQGFTRRAVRHYRGAPNPFWQDRFYDFNVWTEYKRIEKLRYMHRNPVTRGLVAKPEEWAWSSFRFYAFGESGPVKINDWGLLKMRITKTTSFVA